MVITPKLFSWSEISDKILLRFMQIFKSLIFTCLIAFLGGYLFNALNFNDLQTEVWGLVCAVVAAVLFYEAVDRRTE